MYQPPALETYRLVPHSQSGSSVQQHPYLPGGLLMGVAAAEATAWEQWVQCPEHSWLAARAWMIFVHTEPRGFAWEFPKGMTKRFGCWAAALVGVDTAALLCRVVIPAFLHYKQMSWVLWQQRLCWEGDGGLAERWEGKALFWYSVSMFCRPDSGHSWCLQALDIPQVEDGILTCLPEDNRTSGYFLRENINFNIIS